MKAIFGLPLLPAKKKQYLNKLVKEKCMSLLIVAMIMFELVFLRNEKNVKSKSGNQWSLWLVILQSLSLFSDIRSFNQLSGRYCHS